MTLQSLKLKLNSLKSKNSGFYKPMNIIKMEYLLKKMNEIFYIFIFKKKTFSNYYKN